MRKCLRCGAEMTEGLEILAEYNSMDSLVRDFMGKVRKDIVVRAKAAVCPECGEVSFYLENTQELRESTKYMML